MTHTQTHNNTHTPYFSLETKTEPDREVAIGVPFIK